MNGEKLLRTVNEHAISIPLQVTVLLKATIEIAIQSLVSNSDITDKAVFYVSKCLSPLLLAPILKYAVGY